jgi:hypothetical protein
MRKTFRTSLVLIACLIPAVAAADELLVSTAHELRAAMDPANAGRTIRLVAGTYVVTETLVVPDGATLAGDPRTRMVTDPATGIAVGLAPEHKTVVRADESLRGDIVALGNGSALDRLMIVDVYNREVGGNLVAVASRRPYDAITATITSCELDNPNPSGITVNSPIGRALLIITRNPRVPAGPVHAHSHLDVTLSHSVVRGPRAGSAVFAINFAPESTIRVTSRDNLLGAGYDLAGGVSRPVNVTNSHTTVISNNNVLRSDTIGRIPATLGVSLNGGSGPPFPIPGVEVPPTTNNSLTLRSTDDRIEGFMIGIYGTGARRSFGPGVAGPSNDNTVNLELTNTRIQSTLANYWLFGAMSASAQICPGDGNRLNVSAAGVSVTGGGQEQLADAVGPEGPLAPEIAGDNHLCISGNLPGAAPRACP